MFTTPDTLVCTKGLKNNQSDRDRPYVLNVHVPYIVQINIMCSTRKKSIPTPGKVNWKFIGEEGGGGGGGS